MSLSLQDVEKIASLARLDLTAAEKRLYQEQLSAILEYAQRLNQLDVEDTPPTAAAASLQNILREDVIEPGLTIEEVLFNAARHDQDQFQIQAVLDDD